MANTDNPDQHQSTQKKANDKKTESVQHNHTRTTTHDDNPTQQGTTKLTQKVNEMTKSTRQRKPPPDIQQQSATLQLDKRFRMLYVPLQFKDYKNQGAYPDPNVRKRNPLNYHSTPSSLTRRKSCPRIQGTNSKWKYRTSSKAGITSILHWREDF